MSFAISSTAYRANGKHVEEEIICVDPRDAARLGTYRLRRVIETPVRGGTLCNVYERALETDEVARLIGSARRPLPYRLAEEIREQEREARESREVREADENCIGANQVRMRSFKQRAKGSYTRLYESLERCPDEYCEHPRCQEPPLSKSHQFSTLEIPIAPEIYEDLTGRRPYAVFFGKGWREEFFGAKGQSFIPVPGKKDPGPYTPAMEHEADESRMKETWGKTFWAAERKQSSWDSDNTVKISRDKDWEAKAIARALEEREKAIANCRARKGDKKKTLVEVVSVEFPAWVKVARVDGRCAQARFVRKPRNYKKPIAEEIFDEHFNERSLFGL